MHIDDLDTPALIAEKPIFEANLEIMSKALPGSRLRPHVKAHQSSFVAKAQNKSGHYSFTCATLKEAEGLIKAGLGKDLLLANECVNINSLKHLQKLAEHFESRVMLAVDSKETIEAAYQSGFKNVLIDVNVGLPRCGCLIEDSPKLSDLANKKGLNVLGVMGYEGHAVGLLDKNERIKEVQKSMEILADAHSKVGGEIISAGGTGTYDINTLATEIQAGSYVFMDSQYQKLGLPFNQALFVLSTVISVSRQGWAVCDAGLKSLGMDHGNPEIADCEVWFCSDEHITFSSRSSDLKFKVNDRIKVIPAHVDPTVAYHDRIYLVENEEVLDIWPIDLRGH